MLFIARESNEAEIVFKRTKKRRNNPQMKSVAELGKEQKEKIQNNKEKRDEKW